MNSSLLCQMHDPQNQASWKETTSMTSIDAIILKYAPGEKKLAQCETNSKQFRQINLKILVQYVVIAGKPKQQAYASNKW